MTLPNLSEIELLAVERIRKHGAMSRTSLAKLLEISQASVTAIAGNLLEEGVLAEIGHGRSVGGRRPLILDINPGLGYVAGIDIGATSVDLALADFRGEILSRDSYQADVRVPPEVLLEKINQTIIKMLKVEGARPEHLLGLGMGVPGPVQYPEGLLIQPPLMPIWEGFSIKSYIKNQFPKVVPCIDNDVNIMAIGEAKVGGGIGMDNFMYVKIGTGIGCGVIMHGEIYRGSDGCAGDIGHICIDYNGPVCHCGNTGCLEYMAAGPAIAAMAMQAAESGESEHLIKRMQENGGSLSSIDVGELAAAGDRASIRIINESGKMIGGVLAGLVNFYNPQAIFIGGGVSKIGHQFLSAIRQYTLRRATALSTRSLRIDYSPLGDDAGVYGAIWLVLEHIFALVK
ncbi:MAG: ROK family transcriptional regulator [Anaerolineales bacterium]|nr:ROK family transcriptional regulator [Anaerolineales bacterium]